MHRTCVQGFLHRWYKAVLARQRTGARFVYPNARFVCTSITIQSCFSGKARLVKAKTARQVSTARLETGSITSPNYIPGTKEALEWAAPILGGTDLASLEKWDLSRTNLSAAEHVAQLALIIRASCEVAPALRSLTLENCQMIPAGAAKLAAAVAVNASLTSIDVGWNNIIGDAA